MSEDAQPHEDDAATNAGGASRAERPRTVPRAVAPRPDGVAGARPALGWVLAGGLVAGVLDISYAFVTAGIAGVGPVRVLQSVASGLLGKAAFDGGAPTAALGLLCHFVIALLWCFGYYLVSRKVPALARRGALLGFLYGAVIYVVMTFAVVPLSAAPFAMSHAPLRLLRDGFFHMLLIGLPIGLGVKRSERSASR